VHILEQQAEIIGALELGVLPTGNIEEMLKTLSPEEAHLTKRKFRKIKRQVLRQTMPRGRITKSRERRAVRNQCRKVGTKILFGQK
jgi:hypothetical protein